MMEQLRQRLESRYALSDWQQQKPALAFVTVARDQLRPLLSELRDHEGFTHLVLLTAVDWIEEGQFQLTYLIHNRALAQDIGLRLMVPRDDTPVASIHDLWPTAATYQRELREMFGIQFPDSPGVDEQFILEGWRDIPPYRRDFDTLAYAQQNYRDRPGRETRDPAAFMKSRLYPDEH